MKNIFLGLLLICQFTAFTQTNKLAANRPKLVVGIVVDQMRYDYLYRFYSKYSNKGLKRLMNDGFNCRNNQYHYATTNTGPGHAHVYSGSAPAISGIIGNEWYDKASGKTTYVVEDSTVKLLGDGSITAGKMSPRNMKVTTITDQLRIASQFKSKVIGIALKDRGAILPAGHTGLAYWYDTVKGNWISSDYYSKELPKWVNDFNALKLPAQYITKTWEPLQPIVNYTETEADDQPYEASISGETKAVFPHKITMSSIPQSYFGNEITKRFAIAAFDAEKLGTNGETDFLAVSFSAPDYAGHAFGPQAKEIEDIYLRLDKDIEEMLNHFDKKLGLGNYTVFLTADHGVAEIPAFMRKNNMPAGLYVGTELKNLAEKLLVEKFGDGKYVLATDNYELYLNHETLKEKKITIADVTAALKIAMLKVEGIYNIIDLEDVANANVPDYFKSKLTNLYNPKRSGEIMVLMEPAWLSGYIKGTSHGTMYAYDTHVPLLFYGFGINKGQTLETTYISDIAPTLAQLLKILEPNGNMGKPIVEVLKNN
jgi:predicted AlkP superfamily pyrophosphatase or phosphodiesterase